MFKRMILEDSAAFFTIAAFITALSIYLTIAWRALRMRTPQVAHLASLPFATATPACTEEPAAAEPVAPARPQPTPSAE